MAKVKEGDKIRIHYTGKLENGEVFDSSEDGAPLEFTVGKGELIKGFEKGVIGMSTEEPRTVKINADEAYGPHKQEMVFEFNKSRMPENFDPKVGEQINMQRADGKLVSAKVVDKTDTALILDCNHPLAGKNLTFDVRLLEILQKK